MSFPPDPESERDACVTQVAEAAFGAIESASGRVDAVRLAAFDDAGRVVYLTPKALERFAARDGDELERRLVTGDSPGARRLRWLAASLSVDEPPRLERLAVYLGRRTVSLNLLCARTATSEGSVLLLWEPVGQVRGAKEPIVASQPPMQQEAALGLAEDDRAPARPGNARFLWSLDKDGRFGPVDPTLARALGSNAPRLGETVEALASRLSEATTELTRSFRKRETFSDLLMLWPVAAGRRQARVTLSAAPAFERGREFAGFRGFGRIIEGVEAAPSAGDPSPTETPWAGDAGGPSAQEPEPASAAQSDAAAADSSEPVSAVIEAHRSTSAAACASGGSDSLQDRISDTALEPGLCPKASSADENHAANAPNSRAPAPESSSEAQCAKDEKGLQGTTLSQSSRSEPSAAPERTAEIYVLRQGHGPPGKVVPIRAGAIETMPPPEPAPPAAGESVELSKSERDAFREIARALIRRPRSSRYEDRAASTAGEPGPRADVTDGTLPPAPASPAGAAVADRGPELQAELGEAQLRDGAALLDRLPLGVMVVRDARPLYLNRTLIDLLGYRDFRHFEDADGLAGLFKGRDSEPVSVADGAATVPIVRADGTPIAVDGRAQIVAWGGAPATMIAFRPLAEPHESQAAPRSAGGRTGAAMADELQALLDHATDGAVVLDPAGRIVSLNRPAELLFGYAERDVVGESVLMLLQPHSHAEATARLEGLSREDSDARSLASFFVIGRDRAGQALPLALTLLRIGLEEAPHFGALARDLRREQETERRLIAARDAALAASAAKTDFLAHVSHEIRTPLHAILGFAEVMMEERFGPVGNERYKDYLKDIHASGEHVMSLADDLLDLSKIEAGKFELAFAAVDANALIRECVSLMQPEATRERVVMRVSLFERLPRVSADVRSLKQIMLNLISNAVKFNGPGGQVIVSTALDPSGQAIIRVRDTGVGMSESEVGVALEPFGRIAGPARKVGVGLGLPLTKALVEANGAEFSIKSRREHGTLVEIAFPAAKAAE